MSRRRGCLIGIAVLVLALLIITVIPLFAETNPPVQAQPPWDSPQTLALAQRACFDCHSNQTRWPWFTRIPPGSWLAVSDTLRGRRSLNFSEWNSRQARRGRESGEQIQRGEMPPGIFLVVHPEAVLSATEKQQLVQGLAASLH